MVRNFGKRWESQMKVAELLITSFRGAPKPFRLRLNGPQGSAHSLILVGDNGTGKSTIVDGLEFALQGKVAGYQLGAKGAPNAFSFQSDDRVDVQVAPRLDARNMSCAGKSSRWMYHASFA
jgi:DNA repair exonuclease SbcCD ATPase subunit